MTEIKSTPLIGAASPFYADENSPNNPPSVTKDTKPLSTHNVGVKTDHTAGKSSGCFGSLKEKFMSALAAIRGFSITTAMYSLLSSVGPETHLEDQGGDGGIGLTNREVMIERPKDLVDLELNDYSADPTHRDTLYQTPPDATFKLPKAEKKAVAIQSLNTSGNPSTTRSVEPTEDNGLTQSYTTEITGASAIDCLKQSYEADDIKVVSSKDDANRDHSVNASLDTLKAGDETLLYSGIRSGVYTTPKIKNREERQAAADTRFNENLLLALHSKGLLPGQANAKAAGDDPIIELTIADIGLLSSAIGSLKDKGQEGGMQDDQFAFLKIASNEPREIKYTDEGGREKTIWVKPKILAFNFGVALLDPTIQGLTGVRNGEENAESLQNLGPEVGSKIASLDSGIARLKKENADPLEIKKLEIEKKTILLLSEQLHKMVEDGTIYSPQEDDNYGFTARLNLLCFKLGICPMIHCKSGKDRTARLIEETKFLAISLHEQVIGLIKKESDPLSGRPTMVTGSAPEETSAEETNLTLFEPGKRLTIEEQRLLLAISLNSGNDTVQANCTGAPGNKQWKTLEARIKELLKEDKTARNNFANYKAKNGTET
ncbi:MAG: inositol phosphate phosphatase SopB [Chthoniobacterales bacterium]